MARAELQRRRSRALVIAASVFAALVLVTSFPISALLDQGGQLSAAQAQANQLTADNRLLSAEASRLNNPAVVAAIARADFGFVEPGEKAYDILPTPGAPLTGAATTGHVPLSGPPVAPGSAQSQALVDPGAGLAAGSGPSRPRSRGSGLWGRIAHDLEFWH